MVRSPYESPRTGKETAAVVETAFGIPEVEVPPGGIVFQEAPVTCAGSRAIAWAIASARALLSLAVAAGPELPRASDRTCAWAEATAAVVRKSAARTAVIHARLLALLMNRRSFVTHAPSAPRKIPLMTLGKAASRGDVENATLMNYKKQG